MNLGRPRRPQTPVAVDRSVRRRATLSEGSCAALMAPMLWKTGWAPGLSRFWGAITLAVPAHDEVGIQSRGSEGDRMARSPHELLEAPVAPPTLDQDAVVFGRPGHLAADERMTGEGPEPVPHRRLKRVAELIPSGPPLNLDQLLALQAQQLDDVRLPAAPRPTPERHNGSRRTAPLELLPHRGTPHELEPPRTQTCRMDPRGLSTGRCRAAVASCRLARRARTLEPAPGDVQLRARNRARPGSPTPVRVAATLPGRRMALGAPLLQPSQPIAHRPHPCVPPTRQARGAAWRRSFRPLRPTPTVGRSGGPADPDAPQMHPKRSLRRPRPGALLHRNHMISRNFLGVGDPGLEPGTSSLSGKPFVPSSPPNSHLIPANRPNGTCGRGLEGTGRDNLVAP